MTDSVSILKFLKRTEAQVGILCASYLLYLLNFIAFGRDSVQLWPEIAAVLICVIVAVLIAQKLQGIGRIFFFILAVAFIADFLNVLFLQLNDFNPEITTSPAALEPATEASRSASSTETLRFTELELVPQEDLDATINRPVNINSVFYGLYLFLWICAWATFTYHRATEQKHGNAYLITIPVLIVGTISVLTYQLQSYDFHFEYTAERMDFLFLILELIAVQIMLFCVLMGINRSMLLLVIGFTLGAGSDILSVFDGIQQLHSDAGPIDHYLDDIIANQRYLDAFWAFGKTVILGGLLMIFQIKTSADLTMQKKSLGMGTIEQHHSGLSVYLLMFWMITVAIAMFAMQLMGEEPQFLSMFVVLFSTACVIAMATMTSRFDEVVAYLGDWINRLFERELKPSTSNRGYGKRRITHWLEFTALGKILETTAKAAEKMRENVIFLGPERLNRPPNSSMNPNKVSCFLVMPFSKPWSGDVTRSLRNVCNNLNIHALRGDDIFRPTDILDDIWNGIVESHFVIADITGSNANVFYELGMAHTLGKPVVILAQDADEVPFDLKTRRILIYDADSLSELESSLEECIKELVSYYDFINSQKRSDEHNHETF